MHTSIAVPTLSATLWPISQRLLGWQAVLLALLGTGLLTLSAKISLPFVPVPFTLQTYVVLVLGMVLGWRLAGITLLLYLLEGAMGLPVFAQTPAKGIGVAYMLGPTGGYLVGFVVAATVCGWLAQRGWDRSLLRAAAAMAIGHSLIYVFGVSWLSSLIGFDKAIQLGLVPFLASDALKIALGAATLPLVWRWIKT